MLNKIEYILQELYHITIFSIVSKTEEQGCAENGSPAEKK